MHVWRSCVCVVPLCVHVWKPEVKVICLPLYSLTKSGTYPFQLHQLARKLSGSSCFHPQGLELQTCATISGFHMGSGDLNSGPYDWLTTTLPTEPPAHLFVELVFCLFVCLWDMVSCSSSWHWTQCMQPKNSWAIPLIFPERWDLKYEVSHPVCITVTDTQM